MQQADSIEHEIKVKAKPGRKKNPNYISFEQAREAVRLELIPSVVKYNEWWLANKPKAIPRYPFRVYTKEWISWNDFLGTNNKFNDKIRKWRPIEEAITWVHRQHIKSFEDWMTFARTPGNLPEDIPGRPDYVYNQWISWAHWLGHKPQQAIEAKKIAARNHVFYIVQYEHVPGNIFTFGVEEGGISGLKDRWQNEKFNTFKLFWYDRDKADIVKKVVNELSSPYYGDERQRIVPNIHEIVWHLQNILETITKINDNTN